MKATTLFSSWENAQDVSRANLLFENRNKSYGGYFIRVYYPERILRAFLFAMVGFGLFVTGIVMVGKYLSPATILIPPNTGPETIYYFTKTTILPPDKKTGNQTKKPDNSAKETIPVVTDTTSIVDTTTSPVQPNDNGNGSTATVDRDTASGHSNGGGANPPIDNNKIITVAEVAPQFPGGDKKLFEYLQKNIMYPVSARENNTQGYVYLTFVVDKLGKIRDVKLLRGIGDGCEEEAIRVVKKMPDWIPGRMGGEPVTVQYNLPVNFKLK